jgi:CBS domain containing-hemolysin-like protein
MSAADDMPPERRAIAAGGATALLLATGITAALATALAELDGTHLGVLAGSAAPAVRARVASVRPLLARHHLVALSLALLHAIADEALPVVLTMVTGNEFVAIATAVPLVLLFGELFPAMLVSGRALSVASRGAPLAWLAVALAGVVSAPLAWIAGRISGHDSKAAPRT